MFAFHTNFNFNVTLSVYVVSLWILTHHIQTTMYSQYVCLNDQLIPLPPYKIDFMSIDPEKELLFNIYYNLSMAWQALQRKLIGSW